MQIRIIEGEFSKKARSNAYKYLADIYRREKLNEDDRRRLRSRIDRRTSEKRIQPKWTAKGM